MSVPIACATPISKTVGEGVWRREKARLRSRRHGREGVWVGRKARKRVLRWLNMQLLELLMKAKGGIAAE